MKINHFFQILIFVFCFTACSFEDDSPRQEIETELIIAKVGPCEGDPIYVNPVPSGEGTYYPSMHIKFGEEEWQTYPTYFILDFEFEPRYEYELSVEKTTIHYFGEIPQDGSNPSVHYTLKETLSKKVKEC